MMLLAALRRYRVRRLRRAKRAYLDRGTGISNVARIFDQLERLPEETPHLLFAADLTKEAEEAAAAQEERAAAAGDTVVAFAGRGAS